MAKPKKIEVQGHVIESLRSAMFRVKVSDEHEVLAMISGKLRINHIRIIPGDRVMVEMSPYDMNRGRITYRFG